MSEKRIIKRKKIGKSSVRLEGYKSGGGAIFLKFRTGEKIYHSDDEVHFMHWSNALDEYKAIKSWKDMVELSWRNR